jgi:heme oxygenase
MVSATGTLSELLRAETTEHHRRAEGKRVQQALVKGEVSRQQYGAWLGQMLAIHEELAAAVRAASAIEPRVGMAGESDGHAARLRTDMGVLAVAAERALPSTGALVAKIRTSTPAQLVGMQYVLDGSMNGNAYIARGVRRGLGLTAGQGDTYLDPYGERQRGVWAAFKAGLDALGFDEGERGEAVEGARVMFDGIAEMSEELGGTW